MLQQVLLIEKTKFIYKLLAKTFKSKDVNCYVVEEQEDLAYLVDDIKPQAIVANIDDIDISWLKKSLTEAKFDQYVKIAITSDSNQKSSHYFDQVAHLPIDPFSFVENVFSWTGEDR